MCRCLFDILCIWLFVAAVGWDCLPVGRLAPMFLQLSWNSGTGTSRECQKMPRNCRNIQSHPANKDHMNHTHPNALCQFMYIHAIIIWIINVIYIYIYVLILLSFLLWRLVSWSDEAWHLESFSPSGEELDIGTAHGWEAGPGIKDGSYVQVVGCIWRDWLLLNQMWFSLVEPNVV